VTALLRLDSDGAILAFFRGDKLIGYRNFQGAPVDEAAEKKVAKEIHRTMLAHQASEGASGEIGAICVTGPNADKFRSLLQERFADIPFRVIGFNDNSVVDIPPFLLAGAEQCQLAIALAHAGLGNGKNQVNFRQEEFAPVSLLSRLKPNIYFSLGVLAVALTAWFASVSFSNRYQTRQLEALNQEMVQAFADTLPTVKSPEDVQRKIREEQEKFRLLKRYSSDYVAPLDALAEVTAGIPEGKPVALSDFGISDNTLRISGEVESFDDINLFKSNLDNSALLADVKIESATKAEKTNKITFRIKAQVGRRPQASAAAPSGGDA
jgi:Tfp pilus assembly protein PilN